MKFKESPIPSPLNSNILIYMQDGLKILLFYILGILPTNNKRIVIQCFKAMIYCNSTKYICKKLLKQKTDWQIVWITKNNYIYQFPNSIKLFPIDTFCATMELTTAKIWIDNCRKKLWVGKRPQQFYLQTWHNGTTLKRVEDEAEKVLSKKYLRIAKNDSKVLSAFSSISDFVTNRLKKYFWYSGNILVFDLPKNDILFKYLNSSFMKKHKQKVFLYLDIPYENRVLLYASTFRCNFNTEAYLTDCSEIMKSLDKKTKWIKIEHFHLNIQHFNTTCKHVKETVNAYDYESFQELLLISDVLVTDHSSSMFEFAFMKKNIFLFTPNYEKDRTLTFFLHKLLCIRNKIPMELVQIIKNFNNELYLVILKKLYKT